MRSLGIASGARDQRGQSVVEVALTVPLLLLIVLGLVDVGRAYTVKTAATNAAREAAIYAARDPQATADAICERAITELSSGSGGGSCTVEVLSNPPFEQWRSTTMPSIVICQRTSADPGATPEPCGHDTAQPRLFQTDGQAGSTVTVTVSADVSLISLYLVGRVFGANPVTVAGSATFGGLGQ